MSYTELFTEVHVPLAKLDPVSASAERVTAWVSVAKYNRVVAVVQVGAVAANRQIIARIEQAKDTNGTGQKVIAGKESGTILTPDQNGLIAIELRTEELDTNNLYDCINLKLMIQGGAIIASAILWGIEPRYAPVGDTAYIEVVA